MGNYCGNFLCLLIGGIFLAFSAQGQGSFQNLDFSAAQIPPNTPNGSVLPAGQALPGWNVYAGSIQETTIGYNLVFPDVPGVTLCGLGGNIEIPAGSSFTAVIQAGFRPAGLTPTSISQSGLIPVTAMSLVFTANSQAAGWVVTIDGQTLPVTQEASLGRYGVYEGSISAFAGKTVLLDFTALAGQAESGQLNLAEISFSPYPVPEPGSCALLLGGAGVFFLADRRRFR